MKRPILSAKEKRNLIRIIIALLMFAAVFAADKTGVFDAVWRGDAAWLLPFALYLAVYIFIGYDVLWKAVRNICRGQVFDENFLMCVATLGAFALAIYRGATGRETDGFDEACAVLLFYQVGEWFQSYAAGKSRRSIAGLMDIRPDYANILRADGTTEKVDPAEVAAGDVIVVNPGEKVPLDGVVTKGESLLDTKALTGESLPAEVRAGSTVISGSINLTSQLEVRVEREFYNSTVAKILELVESAAQQKSKTENFITKFARYYTPAVCGVALMLALLPGIITGDWGTWIYRALSFLVVSCPCALVISVPLSFFAGIGAASRYGILIKGSDYLEKFNRASVFVFDKTGTLTKGDFAVTEIYPPDRADEVLRLAAIAERDSSHPIAKSIVARYGGETPAGYTLTDAAGAGVIANNGSDVIMCGNRKLMRDNGIKYQKAAGAGTAVYVAHNGEFAGWLLVADEIKPEAREVVQELRGMNCKTVMLTGDNEQTAKSVADSAGIDDYKASLLPQNKVEEVERLLAEKKSGDVLCFVGDGINDAPVLMRSDVGIAMGGAGSDAAIEASDIVLMKDDLRGIALAKRIARKTMAVVAQNIVFSLCVKAAILILLALGAANMWLAVFGDVGVAVIAILNAMRVNSSYDEGVKKRKTAGASQEQ